MVRAPNRRPEGPGGDSFRTNGQIMVGPAHDGDLRSLGGRLARRLGADPSVRLAWLHGSRARRVAHSESDIDIAVLLDAGHAASPASIKDSIWRLAGALGREAPSDRLDLVFLNDAPALLRHRVIRDGILLFARSEAARVHFVLRTIRDYQDIEPRLREHTRRRVERLKNGRAHGRPGRSSRDGSTRWTATWIDCDASVRRRSRSTSRSRGSTTSPHAIFTSRPKRAIDIANHWIADHGLRTPGSNRDSFTVLEEAGEIEAGLAERLRGWAGFRNILVHGYVDIDHRIAYAAIHEELGDLAAFPRLGDRQARSGALTTALGEVEPPPAAAGGPAGGPAGGRGRSSGAQCRRGAPVRSSPGRRASSTTSSRSRAGSPLPPARWPARAARRPRRSRPR